MRDQVGSVEVLMMLGAASGEMPPKAIANRVTEIANKAPQLPVGVAYATKPACDTIVEVMSMNDDFVTAWISRQQKNGYTATVFIVLGVDGVFPNLDDDQRKAMTALYLQNDPLRMLGL